MSAVSCDLGGKHALVVGGAGYLGVPVCEALAAHGAKVCIADVSRPRLDAAAESVRAAGGPEPETVLCDIGDEDQVRQAIAHSSGGNGQLDICVNAAYRSIGKKVEALTAGEFNQANEINITAAFLLVRAAAEAMDAGGSIVLYTSMYGLVAPVPALYEPPRNPNPIEYGAAKAAVAQMTRYLAGHYGPRGIRVNAVAPGPFPWESQQEQDPAFIDRLASRTMLGRIGRQKETAGAVLFLASDAASYVTGHVLCVDGGWTAW